jgi:uncharacterized RDD family membrane protein YckC
MRCVRCGKEQSDRSIHCPYCGNRLQRDSREANETATAETVRPTLIEFPTTPQRNVGRQQVGRPLTAGSQTGLDWRAELSERVKQVKQRRNIEEARGRLQAELEAAAQRYQQSAQTITSVQETLPSDNLSAQPAEGPSAVPSAVLERVEADTHHPNPIIDAALRRARRATETVVKRQQLSASLATAAAPKIPPQVQITRPKPAEAALPITEQEPSSPAEPDLLPSDITEPATVPTLTSTEGIETPSSPATVAESRPRLVEVGQLATPSGERPTRVIKESEDGPNYLDELIAICEQNLSNDHARYSQRAVAAVIDLFATLLFTLPYWAISYAMGVNFTDPRVLILLGTATLIIALIYLTLAIRTSARTLGMIFVGTRVIDSNTGAQPSLLQALLRSFGYILSIASIGIGFLFMFLDRERRGLHDLISGTSVVRDY